MTRQMLGKYSFSVVRGCIITWNIYELPKNDRASDCGMLLE